MPTVKIHPPNPTRYNEHDGSLPGLMQTPLGYALLELQGTINFPSSSEDIELGRVAFPDYDPATGSAEGPWMRKIYLYVGHQRMTGEVQKLKTPIGLLRKCSPNAYASVSKVVNQAPKSDNDVQMEETHGEGQGQEKEGDLEITEIIYYKLVFRSRPEPVGLTRD